MCPQYAKTGDGVALRGLLSGGKLNVQPHLVVQCEQITSVLMAGLKCVEDCQPITLLNKNFCTGAFHCIDYLLLYTSTPLILYKLIVLYLYHIYISFI